MMILFVDKWMEILGWIWGMIWFSISFEKKIIIPELSQVITRPRKWGVTSLMGELTYFLGVQVKQIKEIMFVHQAKYLKEMLKKFGMLNAKEIGTPMSISTKLDKDEQGKSVDPKLYKRMIGSLLYLMVSRPDIMFSICLCTHF